MKKIGEVIKAESTKNKSVPFKKHDFDLEFHWKIWLSVAPEKFILTKHNKHIIERLLKYYAGVQGIYKVPDHPNAFNTKKGIYLWGDYGIGKTTIMDITRKYLAKIHPFHPGGFKQISTEHLIDYHKKNNNLDYFGYNNQVKGSSSVAKPGSILVNEFATEQEYDLREYGTNVKDVFKGFYMIRYEIFTQYHKKTHVTSNINPENLPKYYDDKLMDRFIEMFDFVKMNGESFRK